jgi:serine O-acetyltransferase
VALKPLPSDLREVLQKLRSRWQVLPAVLVIPLVRLAQASPAWEIIQTDAVRTWDARRVAGFEAVPLLRALLARRPEFRTVFYYRLERAGGWTRVVAFAARLLWPPLDSFEIECSDIGPGFVAQHCHGTILFAERIGANFKTYQQVTVGWKDGSFAPPTIGDDVTLGNHVSVGANAVVLHDVPDDTAAVGVPARHIAQRT